MNNLKITNQNGILVAESRDVAEMTGKDHKNLLRDIKGYIKVLNQSSNLSTDNFFVESYYTNENNQNYPCYLLTRIGCDMVANKMTGEKGILFTAEYVTQFEKMEKEIKNPIPKLSKELQAIFAIDQRTVEMDNRISKLENTMTIDYAQQEELRTLASKKAMAILGGTDSPAYKELNKKVFPQIWRDYKRVMVVNSYKNTAVKDFGIGKKLIIDWKPSRELTFTIQGCNSQLRM